MEKISQVVQWRQGKKEETHTGTSQCRVRCSVGILSKCNEFLVACGTQARSTVNVISVGCKRRHDKANMG